MAFRILSIDGGGLRGIVPLLILETIEKLTGKPISESFDLIAGTSTGAIIACALTVKDKSTDDLMYNIEKIKEIYSQYGTTIFPERKPWLTKKFHKIKNIIRPRFSDDGLNQVLTTFFGDSKLADCITPVIVSSYCVRNYRPIVFTSRYINKNSKGYDYNKNIGLVNLCRATSAAPTFLPSYYFQFYDESNAEIFYNCIDGGVYVNNPSLMAITEVLKHSSDPLYAKTNPPIAFDDIYLLSLGTGKTAKEITREQGQQWGLWQWKKPVIDTMMQANAQIVDFQVEQILKDRYLRLDIPIEKENDDMADSSMQTRNALIGNVNKFILYDSIKLDHIKDFISKASL